MGSNGPGRGNPLTKTALIVDDSKSARIVLKRMLEAHELNVDTAESAESALEYLNGHRPDVIFMDHLMPGMDGFQAVTAIKNNPDTATIPIMMYTSQEGEVYVGQARALGAVGVLPKQVEPVEVSKVLESLRVIGAEVERSQGRGDSMNDESGVDYPALEKLDQDLRELIQDLFDQQRAVLRRDLLDSYEAIAARVADEIRSPAPAESSTIVAPANERLPGRFLAVASVLVGLTIVFGWMYWQREQSWQEVQHQNVSLLNALTQQQSIESDGALETERRLDAYQQSLNSTFLAAVAAVEWSINQAGRYAFGEPPLGDSSLELLEGLVDHLQGMGFSGRILIETHVGDFCMVGGGPGGYDLAPPGLGIGQCELIGFEPSVAYEMGLNQSVAFANYTNTLRGESGGTIQVRILSRGNSEPLIPYPAPSPGLGADFWNEIAAQNNRVVISLDPFDQ